MDRGPITGVNHDLAESWHKFQTPNTTLQKSEYDPTLPAILWPRGMLGMVHVDDQLKYHAVREKSECGSMDGRLSVSR
jgi:hypothetical protein